MNTPEALLRAVIDSPEDDLPRLAYADWLEENGEGKRAHFIRTQVHLSQTPEYDRFWLETDHLRRALISGKDHRHRLPPLPGGISWAMEAFWRGFGERVRAVSIAAFLQHAEEIFRLAPVRHLEIDARHENLGKSLALLADSPWLGRLRSMELSLGRMGPEAARRLGESPHAQSLRCLSLPFAGITRSGAEALITTPLFLRLRELDLGNADYGDPAGPAFAAALRQVAAPCALEKLSLYMNRCGPAAVEHLSACPALGSLVSLNLGHCSAGRELRVRGMQALASSPHLANLRQLGLTQTEPTVRGLRELVNSSTLTNLRDLDLRSNHLGPQAGMLLAGAENVKGLTCLRLGGNEIGDRATAAIARSPCLAQLAAFEVANAGDEAGQAFLESPNSANLVHLALWHSKLSPPMKDALKKQFGERVRIW
jgi:uncharacterized protein (TIGR02996 family)